MDSTGAVTLIGVDMATKAEKVGLALGSVNGDAVEVNEAHQGTSWPAVEGTVATWIKEQPKPVLIAIDAPLGWPRPLGQQLQHHVAGRHFCESADAMFQRKTDQVVRDCIGKKPLDVGADKIARAAHQALRFLDRMRWLTNAAIPLAWTPRIVQKPVSAIEVYPAATLKSHGLSFEGYKGDHAKSTGKKPSPTDTRCDMVRQLFGECGMRFPAPAENEKPMKAAMEASDHVLDAVVCVLAAADFVRGKVREPTSAEKSLSRQEGWIWVREPCPER